MKNKKCLGFLAVTLMLIVSMFSNAFASSNSGWVCTEANGIDYHEGSVISKTSEIYIVNEFPDTSWFEFESNFTVKQGDRISLGLGACLYGYETSIDGTASICRAELISEDGTVVASVSYNLRGSADTQYETDSCTISSGTAGKLKLYLFTEDPGRRGVYSIITDVNVTVNGQEV